MRWLVAAATEWISNRKPIGLKLREGAERLPFSLRAYNVGGPLSGKFSMIFKHDLKLIGAIAALLSIFSTLTHAPSAMADDFGFDDDNNASSSSSSSGSSFGNSSFTDSPTKNSGSFSSLSSNDEQKIERVERRMERKLAVAPS